MFVLTGSSGQARVRGMRQAALTFYALVFLLQALLAGEHQAGNSKRQDSLIPLTFYVVLVILLQALLAGEHQAGNSEAGNTHSTAQQAACWPCIQTLRPILAVLVLGERL